MVAVLGVVDSAVYDRSTVAWLRTLLGSHRKMMRKNDAGAGQGVSVIALGARVVGDVHTTGVVRVAGNVVGNVRAGRQVLVAKGGMVEGEIETPEAIIGGEVRGLVRATQRVSVQASAVVYGTITTPRLAVEEGATLDVDLSMSESRALLPLPTDTQKPPLASARLRRKLWRGAKDGTKEVAHDSPVGAR